MVDQSKSFPFYWVYRRDDGWLHMVNASSQTSALAKLNIGPYNYTILEGCLGIEAAKERIHRERHSDF